jgi:glycosyltransferase involved in cell wall biosynthesis
VRALAQLELAGGAEVIYRLARFVNASHDLWVSQRLRKVSGAHVFFGCQGVAMRSMTVARDQGWLTVLDAFHPLSHEDIVADERRRLGLPPSDMRRGRSQLAGEAVSADLCIAASVMTAESLIAVGVPKDRVAVIPYGVDLEKFRPRINRLDNRFRVLFVGKLTIHKGFQYLLDAWRRLDWPDAELVMIGQRVTADDQKVIARWAGPRVKWVASVDDISAEFAKADVFVLPSLIEGFGMVTLEAMASGLPVIVTTQAASIVRDGVEGFVVPAREPVTIAERIRRLYEDRALRRSMAHAARARAAEFPWSRYQQAITDLITELNRSRRSRR